MKEGDLIAQRFRLEMRAASGGMGTIYRGVDQRSGERVAVKTWTSLQALLPPTMDEPSTLERLIARFEREASALASIQNPAIVPYVCHGTTLQGEPFLVMRWVEGQDLAAKLSSSGITVEETLLLGRRLLSALSELNTRGIVHRDLKPANIMLDQDDVRRAVLVDFGVARRTEAAAVTVSGARVGTPCYMAPEQIRDARQVDSRADVFALGCVLFECLSGRRAFAADDALAVIAQILLERPRDLTELRPELPRELADWIALLLSRDRELRPWPGPALASEAERLLMRFGGLGLGPPTIETPSQTRPGSHFRFSPQTAESVRDSLDPPEDAGLAPTEMPFSSEPFDLTSVVPAGKFFGRSEELSHLSGWLWSGNTALSLWGPAGIGKTHLARQLFSPSQVASLPSFQNRWFIDLAPARNIDDALRIMASRLDARVGGGEEPSLALGRAVGAGCSLVVFDAIDGVAADLIPMLSEWRSRTPQVRFLTTSRERLRWQGALHLELGPLPTRSERELLVQTRGELSLSAQLFLERAREHGARLALDEIGERAAERIVLALDGLPLAIELAAARVPILGLEGVLARLSKPLELLGVPGPSAGVARGTLREAISASIELLTEEERLAWLACSVFAGAFSAAAAEAVIQVPSGANLLDLLQSLRNKSLLSSFGNGKLCLYSVVRDYALSELARSGGEPAVRTRHAAYFGARARWLDSLEANRGSLQAMRAIEAEADDLISAADQALSGQLKDLELGMQLLLALEPLMLARGPLPFFLELLDRANQTGIAQRQSTPLFGRVLLLRARLLATTRRFGEALQDLDRVLAIAQGHADTGLEGPSWLERGVIHHFQHDLEHARAFYQRALEWLPSSSELALRARCYGNLGAVLHDEGKLTEAAAHYFKAIQLLEETGESRVLANCLGNLAVLEQELGARAASKRHYERASSLLEAIGDTRLRAIVLGNLGTLEAERGQLDTAKRWHQVALELLGPLGDNRSEALCRARLAAVLVRLGAGDQAEQELIRATRLVPEGDSLLMRTVRLHRAFIDLELARGALIEQDRLEANARLEQAEARCREIETDRSDGRSLPARSDDIRSTLRMLEPLLAAFRAELHSPIQSSPTQS